MTAKIKSGGLPNSRYPQSPASQRYQAHGVNGHAKGRAQRNIVMAAQKAPDVEHRVR